MKSFLWLVAACMAITLHTSTAQTSGDASLTEKAWTAFLENRQEEALQTFQKAIEHNPNDLRAQLGLLYYNNLHDNYPDAWKAFSTILHIEKNYYPYAYAEWVQPMNFSSAVDADDVYKALFQRTLDDPKAPGILRAMAAERVGSRILLQGDVGKAKELFARTGSISQWNIIGPFDNVSASGYNKQYEPEKEYNPSAVYEGIVGVPTSWFPLRAERRDGWIDFTLYFYYGYSVYYANTFVYSPEQQTVDFRVGTSGFFKAFLNDEVVLSTDEEFNNDIDTYIARTTLQKGWNRILIKCGNSEIDRCNFLVRITDAQGTPIPNLQYSTEKQTYKAHPKAPIEVKNNFAEEFFQQQIEQHPDYIENYLLLADCYLRNDKGVEAEKILNKALKRTPNAIVLLDHMLEAYIRGRKYDEISTTLEKLATMKADVPSALEYQISEHLKNEEYAKAEELIDKLERFIPNSEKIYAHRIGLYAAKEQYDKVMELNAQAYKKFPNNFGFASMAAIVADKVHGNQKESINILEEYADHNYTETAILTLANAYLAQSKFDKWEEIFQRVFELSPASPGYYNSMASTYFGRQNYDKAESSLLKALEICPANPTYYKKLGDIYRNRNQTDKAIDAFRKTLTYDPTDYETRAVLRELEGKKPIFDTFSSVDIDSLIRTAPSASEFPNDPAIFLLDDVKRVVYDGGSSETLQEMLIKVLNKQGIDNFKEYSLGYNSHSEALNIEKAVVRKQDGTEIKADIDGGYIVFKSLEEGDYLHIKWRKKNYYGGRLHKHFWDTYYFNFYYPIANIRYSLLVPKNYKFNYTTRNMEIQPTLSETPDGVLHTWSLRDEPAIIYEAGMPSLEESAKMLTISSIQDWAFIVDWYGDIANTKTRTTYEIEDKVKEILAQKPSMSEDDILREVYEFITEYIRYSSVSFRQSGWVPQKARDVLVNKIGDCKDVATLCIAMLREAGITADYVLVKTAMSSRAPAALPMPDFDHCIVRVDTKKGKKFLDLTANNFPIGSVPQMDIDGFALPIKAGTTKPITLTQSHFAPRGIDVQTNMTVKDDGSVLINQKTRFSGSTSAYFRDYFRHKGQDDQKKAIVESLGSQYPNVKLQEFNFVNLDTIAPYLEYNLTFEVPDFVTETGRFKILKSPWSYSEETDEALAYEQRKYPYAYYPSADTISEHVEIRLPKGYAPVDIQGVTHKSPIAEFATKYAFTNGVLTAQRLFVNKQNTVSTDMYADFKTFYNKVVKEDSKQILLEEHQEKPVGKKRKK